MRKVLIVDTSKSYRDDIDVALLLEEPEDLEIDTFDGVDGLHQKIKDMKPDELVICSDLIESHSTWDFGIPVKTYAKDSDGFSEASKTSFPCYGITPKASQLIESIEDDRTVNIKPSPQPESASQETENEKEQASRPETKEPEQTQSTPSEQQTQQDGQQVANTAEQGLAGIDQQTLLNLLSTALAVQNQPQTQQTSTVQNAPAVQPSQQEQETEQTEQETPSGESDNLRDKIKARQKNDERQEQRDSGARDNVKRDLGYTQDPAKLVAVYSAKGGIGKTTIACELATVMALTAHGRGNLKVCIVDMDLLYPSVLNTLDFDSHRITMNAWVDDIEQKRMQYGSWDAVQYTSTDIERFLQKKEDTGLYALIAPTKPETYAQIPEEDMEDLVTVMLNNLVQNGGFDFIICDTGNNLNLETQKTLMLADTVLLIVSQSMNAVNANNVFLKTIAYIDFDFRKIKLVVNFVRPAKNTGISVTELESALIDPDTERPFDCYGEIKEFDVVRNAENYGVPMAMQPNHEFTKSINQLKQMVIGDQFTLPEREDQKKKKGGFFSRLFHRDRG